MNVVNHILGFPRIGLKRDLKKALEKYWTGKINKQQLFQIGYNIKQQNWKQQKDNGIDLITVGDFAWYDQVLTTTMMIGNIPERHRNSNNKIDIDTLFNISRGIPGKLDAEASEMKKWFNTNYHYIVPEFYQEQSFTWSWFQLIDEIKEAQNLGYKVKPTILGPLTYLWLGKIKNSSFEKLSLLKKIIPIYKKILKEISLLNVEWIQIDEPILAMELPKEWLQAYHTVFNYLKADIKILLTTYFDSISHNFDLVKNLSIDGIHLDLVHGKYDNNLFYKKIPDQWTLSLGIINGRNIWRADLIKWFKFIKKIKKYHNNIWIGSSCSLLHCPIDLNIEKNINKEIYNWLSFAIQKCKELSLLKDALNTNETSKLYNWSNKIYDRSTSNLINDKNVNQRLLSLSSKDKNRTNPYQIRDKLQRKKLKLPILPTTTIGSFPQTKEIRKIRMDFKKSILSKESYNNKISEQIKNIIYIQEKLGLDVLVHGEPERNDMVEYFGENLNGFIFTQNGWIQSYGSRCVKPPIIIGDISRSKNITSHWSQYAQSLTLKPVKGMLTGPVTILLWSFPREDISKEMIANQIALAIRDEVKDLENIGIKIIQIDEPALREGLPLRKSEWNKYLKWAVSAFRISASIVKDDTQIHTHMCYSEFNDIIHSIAGLDADVITIETSRSNMSLLESFKNFRYPNSIGPGVYDIHSPIIPSKEKIEKLILKALEYVPLKNLWINPDCGLKTRNWDETKKSIKNMVNATKKLRKKYK